MSALFEELAIGTMAARNRLVRAATTESLAYENGHPTQQLIELYEELARGGVGTIVTGYAYVAPDGKPSSRALSACSDAAEPAYRALVDAVHAQGAKIVLQLVYGGSKSKLASDDDRRMADAADPQGPNVRIAGPSAVANPATALIPYEASYDDLVRIERDFANAASRAKRLGFDGVEIHAAHGYLLGQFLSPFFNRRKDEYGGSIENRARFACECIAATRNAVGEDYPVIVKLNSSDARDETQGLVETDSIEAARLFVDSGTSAIEVSGDWHAFSAADAYEGPFFGEYGERLATVLEAPVIVTGGWRDPRKAEDYLSQTRVSGIGMSRPLICEPDLPAAWKSGKMYPARCSSCNYCAKHPGIPCVMRK